MDWLRKLVSDPGWWVTAVFVGLIVSVAAGFLKDAISRLLASFSKRFRTWRSTRRAAFVHKAELLARDYFFILRARIDAVALLVVWSMMLLLMLAAYMITKSSAGVDRVALIGVVGAGLLSFFPYFMSLYLLRLSREANRIYLRRHYPPSKKA